jgi:hypothetical protein
VKKVMTHPNVEIVLRGALQLAKVTMGLRNAAWGCLM